MNLATLSTVISISVALTGGGWWAATTLVAKEDFVVVATKAEVSLNEIINYLSAEIARLEVKLKHGQATEYDKDQLQVLRKKREALERIQQQK